MRWQIDAGTWQKDDVGCVGSSVTGEVVLATLCSMCVRTCVLVALLASGLSEWVQLPVLERREDRPAWPGKYFNQAASPSRRLPHPTPPAYLGTVSPSHKGVSLSTVPTTKPAARQHPILVVAYSGKTPRVQFVRPAIFVGNRTLVQQTTTLGPDMDVRQSKEGEAGLFGLVENPLDVLRKVHESLKMQTPRSVLAKLKFLHDLRENLLFYVDQYLRRMWGTGNKRKAREVRQRPPVEGNFMVMSFLMLGAFTVQLVQQVISNLSGTDTRGKRRSRSVDEVLASAKIMSYMELYQMEMQAN